MGSSSYSVFASGRKDKNLEVVSENAYPEMRDLALLGSVGSVYTENHIEEDSMSALLPFLALDQTCDQVDAWVREKLTEAGLHVVPTFDLQIARMAHPDCPCPHHGTEGCSCQLVILLVYGKQEGPATLIIHGQDGKSWISFATPLETRSLHSLESSVRHTLIPRLSRSSSVEAATFDAK